jgi:hypothetical protein
MALSREKAKQPSKGIPLKSPKPVAKAAKNGKKPTPIKAVKASAPVVAKAKTAKPVAIPVMKAPKGKVVAAPQPPSPVKAKSTQLIEKAKAALKTEKTSVDAAAPAVVKPVIAAPVKPLSKAKQRKIMIEASANEAASALAAKWASLFKKADQIDAKPYNMKAIFEEKTAIVHKVLGWGYILANRNDRLEVLFKDGIKHLISNYKP